MIVEFPNDGYEVFSKADRGAIVDIANAAEVEIRALLPSLTERIVLVVHGSAQVIPETGETGAAIAPGLVSWMVDPTHPEGTVSIARSELRAALFHELHHLARGHVMLGGRPPASFMDNVVSEGLAAAFERDEGGRPTPWSEYPDDVREWVAELLALPVNAPYHEWMFLHSDGRRWIGYRAGTYIADKAIDGSGLSAAQLVHATTEEVLKLAGISSD